MTEIKHHPNCQSDPTEDPYHGCECGAVGGRPHGRFAPALPYLVTGVLDQERRSAYGHMVRAVQPGERPTMATSLVATGSGQELVEPTRHLHHLVLDIDCEVRVVPSRTKGHYHLFIEHAISWQALESILNALALEGIIESGYAEASLAQGYTTVRLPGTVKGTDTDDPVIQAQDRPALDTPANDLLF